MEQDSHTLLDSRNKSGKFKRLSVFRAGKKSPHYYTNNTPGHAHSHFWKGFLDGIGNGALCGSEARRVGQCVGCIIVEKELDDEGKSALGSKMQGRVSGRVSGVDVAAGLDETANDGNLAVNASLVERRNSLAVTIVLVGAIVE